jgi:DNA-directed RNA polymerase sigma subunit (sigma70/sigma32)
MVDSRIESERVDENGLYAQNMQARWLAENAASRTVANIMSESRTAFLTADEERALAACVRRGDEVAPCNWNWTSASLLDPAVLELAFTGFTAKRVLIESFTPLVISISYEYLNKGLPQDDLVQEGCLGLIHAIGRYDERRGHRVSTYATPWIHQYMRRATVGAHNLARLPERTLTLIRKVYRAIEQLNSFIKLTAGQSPVTSTWIR